MDEQYFRSYPPAEPGPPGKGRGFGATFLTVLISMIVGGLIVGGVAWAVIDDDGGPDSSSVVANAPEDVNDRAGDDPILTNGVDFSALFDEVRPSVVRITTGEAPNDPFSLQPEGLGSGVVIDEEGHIITNYHVVRGFDRVTVTFSDGTVVDGRVVGTDPGNDIAMVRVDAPAGVLEPARLGDSDAVRVGEPVAALGNPFGLDGTFTTGIISGTGRTLPSSSTGRPIRNLLQTDTAVNPGNSGGALFNARGEVVGINTAIENPNGTGFVGVAYAVPINTPKRFLAQLIEGETIQHPRLGISGRTLSPEEAADIGVEYGVAIIDVDAGSSADRAGLRESANGTGDVITEIDGEPMRTFEDLAAYIDGKAVGDRVTLTVHRDGQELELEATLQSWDSSA